MKKLSARVSGRLPTTLSRASARPSSLLIQLEKPAGPPPVPPSSPLPFPAQQPKVSFSTCWYVWRSLQAQAQAQAPHPSPPALPPKRVKTCNVLAVSAGPLSPELRPSLHIFAHKFIELCRLFAVKLGCTPCICGSQITVSAPSYSVRNQLQCHGVG